MAVAHSFPVAGFDTATALLLSPWSTTAPRDWVSYALCFPQEEGAGVRIAAETHLRASLKTLAESRPEFGGRLRLSTDPRTCGQLEWVASDGVDVEFRDISDTFPSYGSLRAKSFPAISFLNRDLFVLGINPNPADATQRAPQQQQQHQQATGAATTIRTQVPVAAVRGFFIPGGILLNVFMHHAFGDGVCMRDFLDDFGKVSRGLKLAPEPFRTPQLPSEFLLKDPAPRLTNSAIPSSPSSLLKSPNGYADGLAATCVKCSPSGGGSKQLAAARCSRCEFVGRLAAECPEYRYLAEWFGGPTQPAPRRAGPDISGVETACVVFSIPNDNLARLRRCLRRPGDQGPEPSPYVALSTVAFAHIIRHRCEQEKTTVAMTDAQSTLSNPVNWKDKIPGSGLADELRAYVGNATAKCLTRVPTADLVSAAKASNMAAEAVTSRADEGSKLLDGLRAIAEATADNIARVDEAFVAARTRLYRALPDPRNLGLADDPAAPHDMQFNTWRPFGADASFRIPGVPEDPAGSGGAKPERIRKVLMGQRPDYRNVLIMPGRAGAADIELFVSLPVASLAALCRDQGFLRWFKLPPTGGEDGKL